MSTTSAGQGRRVRATSLLGAGALGLGLLAAASVSSAPATFAAGPTNGPLLYHGAPAHLMTIAGAKTDLEFNSFSAQAFSPDGAKIAVVSTQCLDASCDEHESVVRVNSADGSFVDLAPVPGFVTDLSWSPDQANLAVMSGPSFEGDIWRVPVNGDPAVKVLGTTGGFRVDTEGLDWNPTSNSIAFVGTPLDGDGSSLAINTDQLYTVDAFGGAPAKYSAQLPDCEFPDCRTIAYSRPDWSPSGTQLAAYVVDELDNFETDVDTIKEYLGLVGSRGLPSEVKRIQTLVNPTDYSFLARQQPRWSADGSQLLYATVPDENTFDPVAKVVTVAGAAVATAQEGEYEDWQPCPTGTCVAWGEATSGADVRVKVTGYADRGAVGAAEPVVVTVVNRGPETADDVTFTVATPGGSATQGWVQFRGPHDGWTCDTTSPELLTCTGPAGPSLGDGQSVVLELGVVGVAKAKVSKLTATASTSTNDLRPTNNSVTQQQVVGKLAKPKAPKGTAGRVSAKVVRKWGWFNVNPGKQLYILATNIVYKDPVEAENLPGWYGATLWAWAPHQSVYRINFKNRVCGSFGGICSGFLGHPADGGDCYVGSSNYCHLITGSRVIFEGDKVQKATWKFFPGKHVLGAIVRTGPAKKYTYDLPKG